jgi:hypothetical protein
MGADPVGSRSLVRARIRRVVDYCAKLGRRQRDGALCWLLMLYHDFKKGSRSRQWAFSVATN